LRPKHLKYILW